MQRGVWPSQKRLRLASTLESVLETTAVVVCCKSDLCLVCGADCERRHLSISLVAFGSTPTNEIVDAGWSVPDIVVGRSVGDVWFQCVCVQEMEI